MSGSLERPDQPPRTDHLTALRRAFLAIEKLEARLAESERAQSEPIAIVGMGCRFPGGANDPESYWQLLRDGVDAIREVPKDRWDAGALYSADPDAPGKVATRWGGFLDRIDRFDAQFFGISPHEADMVDPQQRLLLEVAWEALESAGQNVEALGGSTTGVFVGICHSDYWWRQLSAPGAINAYTATGAVLSIAANRVSYLFDFQGPSVSVDTACSSSLVAIHLACQSLRSGDSSLALAAGVNLLVYPETTMCLSKFGVMAPDGRCKTFDARADGFVRGEGCGVLVLKRLSDAERDKDTIWGIVRGSAVNQDGRSVGLTAPNVAAQQALLKQALSNARVEASQIGYVEAHGTGTSLGDPIEVEALKGAFGAPRPGGKPCVLGSVKTNIGHLEGAAGIAGVIKAVLALRHESIPRSLHFRDLNPNISLDGAPLVIAGEAHPWPAGAEKRFAGVSSFGFGGTNAHVILEEAPPGQQPAQAPGAPPETRPYVLALSAKTEPALRELAGSMAERLARGDVSLADACYTASVRRTHHDQRLALVARGAREMSEQLSSYVRDGSASLVVTGAKARTRRSKLVFVYPGMGSQWRGMGKQLLEQEPVFRQALEECEAAMAPHVTWKLTDELREDCPKLERIDFAQPALFAIGVGLTALWRSWGVEPDAVVGHSMGEVTAAHAAGSLSLEDAARIICLRSQMLHRAGGQGAMLMVEHSLAEVERELEGRTNVAIAASNSGRAAVLSGDAGAMTALMERLEARGAFCRWMQVNVASHGPAMQALKDELHAALAPVKPRRGHVPLCSTVNGEWLTGEELDAGYWFRNVRQPVLFYDAVKRLRDSGHDSFIEVSPYPVLLPAVEDTLAERGEGAGRVFASLLPEEDEREASLTALAGLYAHGYDVDWSRQYPEGGRCVPLPAYPFQRDRFWIDQAEAQHASRHAGARRELLASGHPMLGRHVASSVDPGAHFWEMEIGTESLPFLADHRVQGVAIFPAAAYVELVLAALAEAFGGEASLETIRFEQAMTIPADAPRTVQLVIRTEGSATTLAISSRGPGERAGGAWTLHATGSIRVEPRPTYGAERADLDAMRRACAEGISAAELYGAFEARGLEYGPSFRGVEAIARREGEAIARLRIPQSVARAMDGYHVHPALLDSCLQAFGAAIHASEQGPTYLPVLLEGLRVLGTPQKARWARAVRTSIAPDGETLEGKLEVFDEQGQLLLEAARLRVQRLDRAAAGEAGSEAWIDALLLEPTWQPMAAAAGPDVPSKGPGQGLGRWLLLAGRSDVGARLEARLLELGASVVVASPGEEFRRLGADRYAIRPDVAGDVQSLLRDAFAGGAPCRGVVHLWGLDAARELEPALARVAREPVATAAGVVHLVQALARAGWRDAPRLWLVTAGAQAVCDGESPCVVQAPLWGLGRVVLHEHPEFRSHCVDLSRDGGELEALLAELRAPGAEDQIALRGDARYAARLVRSAKGLAAREAPRFDPDAAYLVTGGLGGIGLRLVEWLAARGARHLVLVGRSAPSEAAARVLEDVRARGAELVVVSGDVADPEPIARTLAELDAARRPLKGVFHLAAVLDDGILLELDPARFEKVMRPKAVGAWNLHMQTRGRPLDHFVLFSSAASVLGSAGQANYAAANAFLDALARKRRAEGLAALAIDWGAWSDVGRAADMTQALADRGFASVSPEQGLSVLGRLLDAGVAQVCAASFELRQWREFFPASANWPFLAVLQKDQPRLSGAGGRTGEFKARLLAEEPARRGRMLAEHVRETVARVLKLDPARMDPALAFSSMGLDSLMGLRIRNRLEASLDLTLPATLLWAYPTVSALASHLATKIEERVAPAPDDALPEAETVASVVARIEHLSDQDMEQLMLEKLRNL